MITDCLKEMMFREIEMIRVILIIRFSVYDLFGDNVAKVEPSSRISYWEDYLISIYYTVGCLLDL